MKRIPMVCETSGGGVFTYVSQLCNDMCNDFGVFLAYSLRLQTPRNYKKLLDKRICLIQVNSLSVKRLANIPNDTKVIKEPRAIERKAKLDTIHLHSSITGGIGGLVFKGKNNTAVYTPHGYAHTLTGSDKKSAIYKWVEKILGRVNFMTLTRCESEDEVAKTLCKRTACIETGIDLVDLSASLNGTEPGKDGKFTVFTLGRACVQRQSQAFDKIVELVPEARLVWIGNGELENLLAVPNIEVTDWESRKEALVIVEEADIFILCSLGEAIAMSLVENTYIKKLTLVSNTTGNKGAIKDGINGYVCGKAEEYVRRIKAAMKAFLEKLSERAHQGVLSIYSTAEVKRKYIKFYKSV